MSPSPRFDLAKKEEKESATWSGSVTVSKKRIGEKGGKGEDPMAWICFPACRALGEDKGGGGKEDPGTPVSFAHKGLGKREKGRGKKAP